MWKCESDVGFTTTMNASNVVDLTSRSRGPSDECSDDEDERALAVARCVSSTKRKYGG